MATWAESADRWLASAERWRPSTVAPLRVRVWLASEIAWDSYGGVTIEGALQAVIVTRETGRLADDVFDGAPPSFFADIPVPIADEERAGKRIACASWGVPAVMAESVRKIRRRTRSELFPVPGGKGLLNVASGQYKNTEIPIATLATPYVDFFVRGDRDKLRDVLRDVGSISRVRAGGLGQIHGFELDVDPDDRSLVYQTSPQRSLPVSDDYDAAIHFEAGTYDLRECNTRAPYWHRATRALCAVPVPRAFEAAA